MSLLTVSLVLFWVGVGLTVIIAWIIIVRLFRADDLPAEEFMICLTLLLPITLFVAAYVGHYLAMVPH